MVELKINGKALSVDVEGDTPLLWVLRDTLGLVGTKYGCGAGNCGACTVHVDGQAMRACITPVATLAGKDITTIEGLAAKPAQALQQAWIEHQVPQCGYCQTGMIMATAALLAEKPRPSDEEIGASLTNICRCGTYPRVLKAVHAVIEAEVQREQLAKAAAGPEAVTPLPQAQAAPARPGARK